MFSSLLTRGQTVKYLVKTSPWIRFYGFDPMQILLLFIENHLCVCWNPVFKLEEMGLSVDPEYNFGLFLLSSAPLPDSEKSGTAPGFPKQPLFKGNVLF